MALRNIRNKIFDAFMELGIIKDEAEVYCDILSEPQDANKLINKYPEREIRELERIGLVYIAMNEEGDEYSLAIDPEIALNAIYAQKLWEYVPEEGWNIIKQQNNKDIDKYYKAKEYLIKELIKQRISEGEYENGIISIPSKYSSNALALSISNSSNEILGITSPPWHPKTALIWEAIKNRIDKGVIYRRLCDEVTLLAFGQEINMRDVFEAGVNLGVVLRESIKEKYYVIDNKEAIVFVPGCPKEGFKLEMIQINLKQVVLLFKNKFEILWNNSVCSEIMLGFMQDLRKIYLEQVSAHIKDKDIPLIKGMFDYGIYFKPSYINMNKERMNIILSDLHEKGLVIPFKYSDIGYLPNVLDEIREYIKNRLSER